MKKHLILNLFILGGAALYSFLFWHEDLGLNTLLFTVFVLTGVFGLDPAVKQSGPALALGVGTFLTATLVVWHNSLLVKIIHWLSLIVFIGMSRHRELRFLWYGLLLGIASIFSAPAAYYRQTMRAGVSSPQLRPVLYWLKMALIPLLLVCGFFWLYYFANARFAGMADALAGRLAFLFHWQLDPLYLLHFCWGLLLCGAIFLPGVFKDFFVKKSQGNRIELQRERPGKRERWWPGKTLGLKHEYRMALIAVVSLNVLLFLVNLTDLRFVWIETETATAQELKQYVHSGTYLLILAIMLAAAVLLYFFRRNLNFYPDNELLRQLSYVWIIQNAVLAMSVGIRNYHYIANFGLAYKRIGVLLFLCLVLIGLFTLYQKIQWNKTIYYLLHRNAWALYLVLTLSCLVNWDVFITRYNLWHGERSFLDHHFLLHEVSDKNLFLLWENKELLSARVDPITIDRAIRTKSAKLLEDWRGKGWKSWNRADARNIRYLKKVVL